ncbi:MAG: hypothetical protein K0S09_49 [Sphingobacteriaceae bacterium]|jgi:hypothetical protein|nr:hypothetical protein [Sphingobacteriaceae bacterium]
MIQTHLDIPGYQPYTEQPRKDNGRFKTNKMSNQNYLPKIKKLLENGEILTNQKIYVLVRTLDGRAYISKLRRKYGMTILDREIVRNGIKFKEYWLQKSA